MSNFIDRMLNGVQTASLTPEQTEYHNQKIQSCEMFKTISLVTGCVSIFFAAVFPSIFAFCLAGLIAWMARDAYTAASNVLDIVQNVRQTPVLALGTRNRDAIITQVAKNTLLAEPILNIINPSFQEMVELIRPY